MTSECDKANYFAYHLLMPTEIFTYEWIRQKGSFQKLAKIFGVDEYRIQQRILMLSLK